MKKMISVITLFATLLSYSQEKIGSYSLAFFNNKSYNVSASKPKPSGKFSYYIDVESSDKLIDKITLIVENKEAAAFKQVLNQAKDKYVSWSQTAIENKITELDKDMDNLSFTSESAFFYGSKWNFDFNVSLLFRAKIINGQMYLIIQNNYKLTSSENKYIDCDGFYLVFASVKEIEGFVKHLDNQVVLEHYTEKDSKEELFQ